VPKGKTRLLMGNSLNIFYFEHFTHTRFTYNGKIIQYNAEKGSDPKA
jgi:hypothetical protein